jgi:hypothetical protein
MYLCVFNSYGGRPFRCNTSLNVGHGTRIGSEKIGMTRLSKSHRRPDDIFLYLLFIQTTFEALSPSCVHYMPPCSVAYLPNKPGVVLSRSSTHITKNLPQTRQLPSPHGTFSPFKFFVRPGPERLKMTSIFFFSRAFLARNRSLRRTTVPRYARKWHVFCLGVGLVSFIFRVSLGEGRV